MNGNDIVAKLQTVVEAAKSLESMVSMYENVVSAREQEIKTLEAKISNLKRELGDEQSKANSYMSKASDEAANMRKEAQTLLQKANEKEASLFTLKNQADLAIQEAKERTRKLQLDEQAFNNTVAIFERKRTALDEALRK